ncbi:MAG: anaerobic magnesium-protoporphyrin monomethyl ester cyclase [Acidobacteriota bacterium]|nr:anaerobic magnesium-protoporphyrin monomethyl ester cyclase [Acidobacteriota bacterium]
MKLTLIHPPFATLTAVPAGICLLKSYIETHYPHQVLTMDLNLGMFEWIHNLPYNQRKTAVQEMGNIEPLTESDVELQRRVLRTGTYKNFSIEEDVISALSSQDDFLQEFNNAFQTTVIKLLLDGKIPFGFKVIDFMVDFVLSTAPDVIGISVFSNFQFASTMALASIFREKFNIPTVLGGPAMLDFDAFELMTAFPFIQYIILGEAEESLGTLLDVLSSGQEPHGIPGLVYRGREAKVHSTEAALIGSLKGLVFPDYSDLPLKQYYNREVTLPVSFSRGCYWKRCAFCALHHTFRNHYKVRPYEEVAAEIKYLKEKWNCNLFYFIDLSISAKHIEYISKKLIDLQLNIQYCFFSRTTSEYKPELMVQLRESGCVYILWGIESGSQEILNSMDKGLHPEKMRIVLQNSHEAGIKNYIFILLGFPGETETDRLDTSLFIARNYKYIDFVCTSIFILDQNSKIINQPDKYKIKVGRKLPFITKNGEPLISTHLLDFHPLDASVKIDLTAYICKYSQLYWGPLYLGPRGGIYYEHLLNFFLDKQDIPYPVEKMVEEIKCRKSMK